MNKQYISEAFDQLAQMNMKTNKRQLMESERPLEINFRGERISLKIARDIMKYSLSRELRFLNELENYDDKQWEDYRQKVIRNGWKITSDKDEYIQLVKENIRRYKLIEKEFLDKAEEKYGQKFNSLDEIPEGHGRGRKRAFDGTISSFKQLKKVQSDNIESFKLGKTLLYDYYDPDAYGDWSEQPVKGVNSEEEFLSLFKLKDGGLYLPKGTTLDYSGHDNYYDWFSLNGTDKEIGFISDYLGYD